MNIQEIETNTIFLMIRGSQAYGTTVPDSDTDYGGICMPSRDILFGIDKTTSIENFTDDSDNHIDKTIYLFGKAIDLMAENNPNMLDYLYAPDRCIIRSDRIMDKIRNNADLFISKETKGSFLGYAKGQLSRMETHRRYLLNPVCKPERINYDLPEISIFPENQYESITKMGCDFVSDDLFSDFLHEMTELLDTDGTYIVKKYVGIQQYRRAIEWFKIRQATFLRVMSSIKGKFLAPEYRDVARKELKYLADLDDYRRYCKWNVERNEKRKALEVKCGYDSKMAAHALRLLHMGAEIMEGKGINVDRTNIDASDLVDIRLGNQSYDSVMGRAKLAVHRSELAYKTSTLPLKPDYERITELKREILTDYFF